jgi:hypothetical protein
MNAHVTPFNAESRNRRAAALFNKTRRDNPYQPFSFDVFLQLQPSPRDRRAPPLVGVHALIVRLK